VSAGAPLPAPPWSARERAALSGAYAAGRLAHALLIHEAPGAGGDWLAEWAARLVLCESHGERPCGLCRACRRVSARAHPDLSWIAPQEDSRQLRIEQVRELTQELALTSHGGGYKVGVLTPADALNRFAANALLKTLEEPSARTLLILVATSPSRLPPTVLSRCQRLSVRAPTRAEALAWLESVRGGAHWAAALDTIGEAPFTLLGGDPGEVATVGAEARRALDGLAGGDTDPAATAERWARAEWPLRLRCFENWLTERIHKNARERALMTEMRGTPYSPGAGPDLNMAELFGLLDEVRELRATLDVPLNRGVALEALFRRLAP
jgi:DNA polymerase-3 subunit delta'